MLIRTAINPHQVDALVHPYSTFEYAQSLGHIGEALEVPAWGCSVLTRPTRGGGFDAQGVYPTTVMRPDADLAGGLDQLRAQGLISVVLVIGDDHRPAIESFRQCFTLVRPFKTHYVHQPSLAYQPNKHHRYAIRRAAGLVDVGRLNLSQHGRAWDELYGFLIRRHKLAGFHQMSEMHTALLSRLSEVVAFGAWLGGDLVSAHIWVHHDGDVQSHLAASNEEGYRSGAAYLVNARSIEHFDSVRQINLGGAAGAADDPGDGLVRFKSGFANGTARSFLCGAVLDPIPYARLSASSRTDSEYFPAYRASPVLIDA